MSDRTPVCENEFIGELTRRRAAAETLRNIEVACTGGVPSSHTFVAANAVVESYLSGLPAASPIRTEGSSDV